MALILAGLVFLVKKNKPITQTENPGTNTLITATTTDGTTVKIQGNTNGYTIEQVPIIEGKTIPQPIPDLNRAVTVSAGAVITAEAKALATQKIIMLQTLLKKEPTNNLNWIDLGIYQKQAGDYDGAVISWKYASRLSPKDFVSPGNLGNLYAYYLHDNAQAEIYYKKAIANGPAQVYLYIQLAEVYRDVFRDLDRARAIVNQGLTKIPNDKSLLEFQANLK